VPGGSAVVPALQQLFLGLLGSVDSFVDTRPFATALGMSDRDCTVQNDAGEFLTRLVSDRLKDGLGARLYGEFWANVRVRQRYCTTGLSAWAPESVRYADSLMVSLQVEGCATLEASLALYVSSTSQSGWDGGIRRACPHRRPRLAAPPS